MKFAKNCLIPGLALALLLAGPWFSARAEAAEPGPLEKLESIQDQLWAKSMELEAAQRAGNIQETRTLAADMNKLRAQIREERRRLAAAGLIGGGDRGAGMGWNRGDCPGGAGGRGPAARTGGRGGGRPCWE